MGQTKLLFSVVFGVVICHALASVVKRSTTCYGSLGCFSNGGAFHSNQRALLSVTPSSPDSIRTQFELFTRDNRKSVQLLNARTPSLAKSVWHAFKARPTKIIVHGFLDNPSIAPWMHDAKDELLTHGDYNVIVVDWHHGNLPPYTQATANTRVVGAQIAELIKALMDQFSMSPSSFHLIGHSLGAHICGYAGERIPGLGRITGLDPAGPYFQGSDKVVRLDPTDADFVDIIHSDAENLFQLGYGITQTVGHADFYPNKGHDQPGCEADPLTKLWQYGLQQGTEEIVSCNHLRSIKFFIESINTQCPYMGFPCAGEDDFVNHRCNSCPKGGCPSMGFHADSNKPSHDTKYYLTTASKAPFCQYHADVKIQLAAIAGATSERGILNIRLFGDKGISQHIALNQNPAYYEIGDTAEFHVGLPTDFGNISAVEFSWEHRASLTNPLKWNLLKMRHPRLYLHQIDVKRDETGTEVRFCATDSGVETGQSLLLSKSC